MSLMFGKWLLCRLKTTVGVGEISEGSTWPQIELDTTSRRDRKKGGRNLMPTRGHQKKNMETESKHDVFIGYAELWNQTL